MKLVTELNCHCMYDVPFLNILLVLFEIFVILNRWIILCSARNMNCYTQSSQKVRG